LFITLAIIRLKTQKFKQYNPNTVILIDNDNAIRYNLVLIGVSIHLTSSRFIDREDFMNEEIYQSMASSVLEGEIEEAERLAQESILQGMDSLDTINRGYVPGMNQIGEMYSRGEAFLPQLVMAGEAMKGALNILEPELAKEGKGRELAGTVILGTIAGDIHDIGKTLVGTMLTVAGFKVIDLGVDVPVMTLVETARKEKANLIGVSALLTTTMVKQRDVVEALDDLGLRQDVKVIVGGAPVTQDWAEEIGADGYSEDAVGAVAIARKLIEAGNTSRE
jgi:corrinoid protein of di/trimethylamine methyltransferase